ncbi:MAG: glutamine synthetase [Okeania sp. SIO3I5]|uniref:glutamine synthetase family protein n=1 Tax=Okeania sp. SIO3I5 TaxID=2607805 RepID=UPI0013B6C6EB|nr:glutamine synthetase family protein [Okeania sp. SIO3I5]NEQ37720.1 glutamine synthetase [Okeania sp. SIO3I5]
MNDKNQNLQEDIFKHLKESGIKFVRVLFCDNANIIRSKAFHIDLLPEHFHTGVSITVAQQALPVMYDAVIPETGLTPVGEAWLVPDWSTLRTLPYAPTHASVVSDIFKDGTPWSLCPRRFLKQAIASAEKAGLQIKAAFENEFYLLKSTPDGIAPTDDTVFASTLGMDINRPVIDDITDCLIAQKMQVERYHPESGPGQNEISIRYTDALQAADRQISFRETVRGVALKHGLTASFMPKIFADQAGNGCHLHLSLWEGEQNIVPDSDGIGGLSKTSQSFIAGILEHLPALMALTTPSVNSYRRIRPHFWSGAFRTWGLDNREAAVRVPSNFAPPSPTHFELKTSDASANPYLALGSVIVAGLDGVNRGLDLGEPVRVDPGNMIPTEREVRGIDALPSSLAEAIAHLNNNDVLKNALGAELAQAFIAVRQAEWEAMKDMEIEEEVKILLSRY